MVSDDAGDSFSERLRHDAALLGFTLSIDGETVFAGYGDPRVDFAVTSRENLGIYAADASSAAGALAFERTVSDLDVNCLVASPTGLYACATEQDPLGVDPTFDPDFHLGIYLGAELPRRRADFAPLLKLRDVRGPPPWSDGRAGACDAEWLAGDPSLPFPVGICRQFAACDNDPRALGEGALICGEGAGGEGGGGTTSGKSPRSREPRSGCACRSGGKGRAWDFGWAFAFLLGWWHRFRGRCRPSSF
jgi:hypothetical protein